jgi:hypothetical protein
MGARTATADQDLLALLDEGAGRTPLERAVLLARAAARQPAEDVARLPLGRRERLILHLHETLIGTPIESRDTCPHCGETTEFALATGDLQALPTSPDGPVHVGVGGYAVSCRPPATCDLDAAARTPGHDEARRRLLTAIVLHATRDGVPVAAADLPGPVVAAVADALADADPLAELRLHLVCEPCGGTWEADLDLGHFVWCELRDQGRRLLREVHVLATAYGWREDDILALSPARRAVYLGLVLGG